MRIGLVNMDEKVAKAVADRLCGTRDPFISEDIEWGKPKRRDPLDDEDVPRRKHKSTSEQNYALLLRKRRDDACAKRMLIAAGPALLLGGLVGVAIWGPLKGLESPGFVAAVVGVGAAIMVLATVGRVWANRASQRTALNYEILLEELRAVLPYLSLTRAERVYCDNIVMLAAFEANLEARRAIRRTLPQLNELLADSRKLDKQRKSLLPAIGTNPIKGLTEEQQKLAERVAEAKDEVTRASLAQSLEHIKVRIENTRSLEQALERINAQQEAIVNALASSQGAFARMQVAPSVQTETAAQEITQTVADMNQRTIAVEQAVQEVLTLR